MIINSRDLHVFFLNCFMFFVVFIKIDQDDRKKFKKKTRLFENTKLIFYLIILLVLSLNDMINTQKKTK